MAKRKGRFLPDRKVRILREYQGDGGAFQWEVLTTVYAMRRDMRGSALDRDGVEQYTKTVTFVVPRTRRFTLPVQAGGSDAFGARDFGEGPIGGRGQQSGPRVAARGAQAAPGDAVQDMSTMGQPIFLIQDIFEMADRKRVELVCKRQDSEGRIYGG